MTLLSTALIPSPSTISSNSSIENNGKRSKRLQKAELVALHFFFRHHQLSTSLPLIPKDYETNFHDLSLLRNLKDIQIVDVNVFHSIKAHQLLTILDVTQNDLFLSLLFNCLSLMPEIYCLSTTAPDFIFNITNMNTQSTIDVKAMFDGYKYLLPNNDANRIGPGTGLPYDRPLFREYLITLNKFIRHAATMNRTYNQLTIDPQYRAFAHSPLIKESIDEYENDEMDFLASYHTFNLSVASFKSYISLNILMFNLDREKTKDLILTKTFKMFQGKELPSNTHIFIHLYCKCLMQLIESATNTSVQQNPIKKEIATFINTVLANLQIKLVNMQFYLEKLEDNSATKKLIK